MDLSSVPAPIWAATITLIGTAALAPMVKHFFFDQRRRLVARIVISPFKTAKAALKRLEEQQVGEAYSRLWQGLSKYGAQDCYVTVTIHNPSKRAIRGVNALVNSAHGYYQLDESDDLNEIANDGRINVGDLLPGGERVLHLWLKLFSGPRLFRYAKNIVDVFAEEYDVVKKRFPTPPHIRDRLTNRIWLGAIALYALWALSSCVYQALK